eukprot:Selendium_serpulae@DN188_c0_g1_i1.p2
MRQGNCHATINQSSRDGGNGLPICLACTLGRFAWLGRSAESRPNDSFGWLPDTKIVVFAQFESGAGRREGEGWDRSISQWPRTSINYDLVVKRPLVNLSVAGIVFLS